MRSMGERSGAVKLAGKTPTMVKATPPSRTILPRAAASSLKYRARNGALRITTGTAPGRSSSADIAWPIRGAMPNVESREWLARSPRAGDTPRPTRAV
jgi:hypothetical protein